MVDQSDKADKGGMKDNNKSHDIAGDSVSAGRSQRLTLHDLSLPATPATKRWRRVLNNVTLFLAGMYTGERCAGTPRKRHDQVDPRL